MVTGLTLLVVCWLVIALIGAYITALIHIGGGLLATLDFDSGIALQAARLFLLLAGWVLLIIAFIRSDWDTSVFGAAWVDTLVKTMATLPAAAVAALLTALVVAFLPGDDKMWLGIGNVVACLVLTVLSFGGVIYLTFQFGPADGTSLPGLLYMLGYGPLLVVAAVFLIGAVGTSFGAARTHRKAGGISTLLFSAGLVTTYVLLDKYGPLPAPLMEEQITTRIVETQLGLFGVATLFVAGVLGILVPSEDG